MEENNNLQVTKLSLYFANVSVVSNLSMQVKAGTVHGLIGPNGAGKTSVLNCISGVDFYGYCNSDMLSGIF